MRSVRQALKGEITGIMYRVVAESGTVLKNSGCN